MDRVEKLTKHDIRWSFASGIVTGVAITCSIIIALLELVSVVKGLFE